MNENQSSWGGLGDIFGAARDVIVGTLESARDVLAAGVPRVVDGFLTNEFGDPGNERVKPADPINPMAPARYFQTGLTPTGGVNTVGGVPIVPAVVIGGAAIVGLVLLAKR